MNDAQNLDTKEAILQAVIGYADKCHGNQLRRYDGERYIVHPVRVMRTCEKYSDDLSMLCAAVLHDVLEDTPVTSGKLLQFLLTRLSEEQANKTIELVVELTDVYVKEAYPKLNRKKRKEREADRMAATSGDAQTIKYADIIDNSPEITKEDPDFAERYLRECRSLLKRMKKGNPDLHKIAMETVHTCLDSLS